MDHELWSQLSHAMFDVARAFAPNHRRTFDTHRIVRVYLWAVLHERPVSWAVDRRHWDRCTCPEYLPDQSTMSRRLRRPETQTFLTRLGRRVCGSCSPEMIKAIDGKLLAVARHSQDRNATFGHGQGGSAKGYKLHAIWADTPMPVAWTVRPLHEAESTVARDLIQQIDGEGYLLADAMYDRNHLYELAGQRGHQLVAYRKKPGTALGHRKHSLRRLRSVALLEGNSQAFGTPLYSYRKKIEQNFAGLVAFGGGLQTLPSWVRTLPRVRLYVHAKLIINAARIRRIAA
jgi:hypothetical protein